MLQLICQLFLFSRRCWSWKRQQADAGVRLCECVWLSIRRQALRTPPSTSLPHPSPSSSCHQPRDCNELILYPPSLPPSASPSFTLSCLSAAPSPFHIPSNTSLRLETLSCFYFPLSLFFHHFHKFPRGVSTLPPPIYHGVQPSPLLSLSLFFILPPTSSFSSSSSLVFSSYSDHTLSAAGFSDASALRIIPPHSVVMFYFGCCVFSPFCYIRRKCWSAEYKRGWCFFHLTISHTLTSSVIQRLFCSHVAW